MSGKPNAEQIALLRSAAARVRELDGEAQRLHKLINDSRELLEANNHERGKCASNVLDLLKRMDVASDGNYGWEGRVVWFLAELSTQAEQYGRTHL